MARKCDDSPKPERSAKKITDLVPEGYEELLAQIKERIRSAQVRAGLAVNNEMVLLYWQIGGQILARQNQAGWGTKVVDRLAADFRHSFPDMTGLSPRNLKYMRAFGQAWPDQAIVQQPAAQSRSSSSRSPLPCEEACRARKNWKLSCVKTPPTRNNDRLISIGRPIKIIR
jgi:hypothetical protein